MQRRSDTDGSATDESLLAAYAAGDRSASRQILERFAPTVFRLACRMLGNQADAEDVTQDVMLRLWKMAPNWQAGNARLSTWLWRVTANLCTDRLRARRPGSPLSPDETADHWPAQLDRMMEGERSRALADALSALPTRQRIAVVLRHLEGRSNPEIAEILDTTIEAVESLLTRGLRQLRGRLGGRQDELGWTG